MGRRDNFEGGIPVGDIPGKIVKRFRDFHGRPPATRFKIATFPRGPFHVTETLVKSTFYTSDKRDPNPHPLGTKQGVWRKYEHKHETDCYLLTPQPTGRDGDPGPAVTIAPTANEVLVYLGRFDGLLMAQPGKRGPYTRLRKKGYALTALFSDTRKGDILLAFPEHYFKAGTAPPLNEVIGVTGKDLVVTYWGIHN